MRQQEHKTNISRLNFEISEESKKILKLHAVKLGVSIRELATQAIMDKIEDLEMKEDVEKYDVAIEKYSKGEMKTISHDEMMKAVETDSEFMKDSN